MKNTSYTCDWCKAASPEKETHSIWVMPAGKLLPREVEGDICESCFGRLKGFISAAEPGISG